MKEKVLLPKKANREEPLWPRGPGWGAEIWRGVHRLSYPASAWVLRAALRGSSLVMLSHLLGVL